MKAFKAIQETIATFSEFKHEQVLELLMNSAQLELKVKRMFKQLLAEKVECWISAFNVIEDVNVATPIFFW